jgi:glycine/serine hydroxymethyltransferase
MVEAEMAEIARLIGRVLRRPDDAEELASVREEVAVMCSKFTPYP